MTYNTGNVTISNVPAGSHTITVLPTSSACPSQTVTVLDPYFAPNLVSCTWPTNPTAGMTTNMTVYINGGRDTESGHYLTFSGATTGNSNTFTVQANTLSQQFTVSLTFPSAGSGQSCTATLG